MGLWNRLQAAWVELRGGTGEVSFEDPLLQAMLGSGEISKEKALQVPTVAEGVDLIAGIVAGTPIKLYRDGPGKAEEVKNDPRLRLLNDETGDTLNANEFWRAMVRDYYLGKGGYAYIRKEKGEFAGLHYVDEAQVDVLKNEDPIFKDFKLQVGGRSYEAYDFLKILRDTKDGAQGVPITRESGKLIEVAYESLCYELYLVKKGGNKKGFLKSAKRLDADSLKNLKDGFSKMYSNSSDNVVVLNEGLDFQESSNTSVEMQLNENKRTNADEFSKIFHIAPGVMEGSASAGDVASLARLAAIPLMTAIQCALNRDLLRENEKGTLYFAFDTKELLKGDMQSRFAAYKTALDANFMQIDEVRYAEDMEPMGLSWIRLGLQDVLYDPKTKQIYTPNTNRTTTMGQKTLAEGEPLQERAYTDPMDRIATALANYMELRHNENHDPENGQFSSGGGSGKGLTEGGKSGNMKSSEKPEWSGKEAKEPFNYWELSEDKTGFPVSWKPTGFSHSTTLERHVVEHRQSVGAKSAEEYESMAKSFLTSPRGKSGDAFVRKNGDVCRYDYDSGLFATATREGTIKTFWNLKTDRGQKNADLYWEGQKKNGK